MDNASSSLGMNDERRWRCLLSWLKNQHGMDVVDALLVECRDTKDAGKGLFATRACPPSTVLFTVPAKAMININTLSAIFSPRVREMTAVQQISLYLLLHRPAQDEDSLDLVYGPYISTLPRDFSSHPVTWFMKRHTSNEHDTESQLLKSLPPSVLAALENLSARFLKDWEVVNKCMNEEPDIMTMSSRSDFNKSGCAGDFNSVVDDFLWAWLNVNTRCIYYRVTPSQSDPDNLTLCPILDFANHSETPHIVPVNDLDLPGTKASNKLTRNLTFVCSSDIVEGQQLFLRYGGHPNRTLFVNYGFLDNFPPNAGAIGEFSADIDLQDVMEKLFSESRFQSWIRQELEDEGYWGDWSLHSSPQPAHPSYRMITALRLYHVVESLGPQVPPDSASDVILRSWKDTINGRTSSVSEDNERLWRNTLLDICELVAARARDGMRITLSGSGTSGWYSWMEENVRCLWREELEVATAVACSLRAGEEF
ncbi:hypothetical protein BKA93DRAFT_760434 [Sparassis latifolia]|uniref:SET domain-containing protein n=1 Tax=Sparassis crispa TaxID=139825 RepID=A0A401GJG6_9APHY|nr:hypothetical protein SCP_0406880 [Sparassis crispa]GBE82304.1 hypothetical protein SCP_0406880 [Sparassis crispa]